MHRQMHSCSKYTWFDLCMYKWVCYVPSYVFMAELQECRKCIISCLCGHPLSLQLAHALLGSGFAVLPGLHCESVHPRHDYTSWMNSFLREKIKSHVGYVAVRTVIQMPAVRTVLMTKLTNTKKCSILWVIYYADEMTAAARWSGDNICTYIIYLTILDAFFSFTWALIKGYTTNTFYVRNLPKTLQLESPARVDKFSKDDTGPSTAWPSQRLKCWISFG